MTIGEVMRTDVAALRPEDTIATGSRSIRRQRLGAVPVDDHLLVRTERPAACI